MPQERRAHPEVLWDASHRVTAAGMWCSSKRLYLTGGALSVAAGTCALALTVYPCLYRAGEQAATVELPDSDLEITTMRSGGAGKPLL